MIDLPLLPERQVKPRKKGITMMMDKGLSCSQASGLTQMAAHLIDFVKLGFGTCLVSNPSKVKEKINIYRDAGIKVYPGGTLFEACLIRNAMDAFEKLLDEFDMDAVEISDGSMDMTHNKKCEMIEHFAKNRTVLSEVGAKEANVFTDHKLWTQHIEAELEAGSSFVIAEARESGNVGIYKNNGSADSILINKILEKVSPEKMLWEAPLKPQQVWFIKLLGHNVNLGNIAATDIIPLETLRLGLRGDTFFNVLPPEMAKYKIS